MSVQAETAQTPEPLPGEYAVSVRDLRKTFTVHSFSATTLKEMVLKGLTTSNRKTTYNALDGVSFDVAPGRSLGIVGGNGSGKSTLLKLITGISHPDSGNIRVRGQVAALIELGAGFHPDLTGMENIFLQGSILGLSREEILQRLDDVLDFSGLGDFIHTPLKRYSSGMRVRLGFSLAAHSDAQVILIDEVLAVGDAAFQTRCLRRIGELRRAGRTILFVSHSIDHVEMVADDILWLERGKTVDYGPAEDVLPRYSHAMTAAAQAAARREPAEVTPTPVPSGSTEAAARSREYYHLAIASGGSRLRARAAAIAEVRLLNARGEDSTAFRTGEPMAVEVTIDVREPVPALCVELGYGGFSDLRMGFQSQSIQAEPLRDLKPGRMRVTAHIPRLPFRPGRYEMSVALSNPDRPGDHFDAHIEAYSFQMTGRRSLIDPGPLMAPPGGFGPETETGSR